MSVTIIFGTKRLGQAAAQVASEKYPNQAVITVEGVKGAKKSRRILMNTKAAELLGAEIGETQEFVFASVEMGENTDNRVLIANRSTIDAEVDVVYKTSKNKVAYGEDSSEKGKAITSSHACGEIFKFLGLDDSKNVEFELNAFDSPDLEAFSLDTVSDGTDVNELSNANISEVQDQVVSTNNGPMSGEQLADSIKDEVARAEEANPVLLDDNSGEIADASNEALLENEPAIAGEVDEEWN